MAAGGEVHSDRSERLLSTLDNIEKRVESLRNQAMFLESEREDLLRSLHDLQHDPDLQTVSQGAREDIGVNSERLVCRCLTVDVMVTTPRNAQQEDALREVSSYLNELESQIKGHLAESCSHLQLFLNACLSTDGPVHTEFQKALLSCTADDQKKVRAKLNFWAQTINHAKGRFLSS